MCRHRQDTQNDGPYPKNEGLWAMILDTLEVQLYSLRCIRYFVNLHTVTFIWELPKIRGPQNTAHYPMFLTIGAPDQGPPTVDDRNPA